MNFISIKEYFYKIANRCLIMVLLPTAIFIYLYYIMLTGKFVPLVRDEDLFIIVQSGLMGASLLHLVIAHWISVKRLKRYKTLPGLGEKLDRFYEIVMLRMSSAVTSSLLMAAGVLLTGSEWFGFAYMVILAWVMMQWPTARKACRDLALKGDEYEMVFFKKDKF